VAYASAGRPWPAHAYRTFDVTGLCWPLHARGLVESMSLDSLCAHFGIERPKVHRALADARAALEVARRMMALYPPVAA
jgi:DNA polymerase-3 subunit epsilon